MSISTIVVIGCLSLSTIGLLFYVYWVLPRQIESRLRESLRVFSTAVELRFPNHTGLTDRVLALGLRLGQLAGLSPTELRDLEMATHLRDIGLCAIPYRLVKEKPWLQWTHSDFETYDRHAEISAHMLEITPSLHKLAPIVRCHHAPYDGKTGWFAPNSRAIPIQARILYVVTTYVWFERNLGDLLARDRLVEGRGSLFDPELVDAFLRMLTSKGVRDASEHLAGVP
ncbi:MAG TPA: hypothetical protein PLH94_04895 [Fimbriimonadaceae bacterium]|nr:hypothetical protein [Fimbriimonadaceae bacterium]